MGYFYKNRYKLCLYGSFDQRRLTHLTLLRYYNDGFISSVIRVFSLVTKSPWRFSAGFHQSKKLEDLYSQFNGITILFLFLLEMSNEIGHSSFDKNYTYHKRTLSWYITKFSYKVLYQMRRRGRRIAMLKILISSGNTSLLGISLTTDKCKRIQTGLNFWVNSLPLLPQSASCELFLDKFLWPVPWCKLFSGLVAGTSPLVPLVYADLRRKTNFVIGQHDACACIILM